jgi:hypothetical protein
MLVEQAIFTSAKTHKVQGYHLVARSPGIDEALARCLTRWCPSHGAIAGPEPDADSLNFHPLENGYFALSRTMFGGPEYSARGGLQVVTRAVILRAEQLDGYDCNPLTAAMHLMALGYLRFEPNLPTELDPLDIPRRCVSTTEPQPGGAGWNGLLGDLMRIIASDGRTCVVGVDDPLRVLSSVISRTVQRRRVAISFSTGLKPSKHRPVQVHFLPSIDAKLRHQLESAKLEVLQNQN